MSWESAREAMGLGAVAAIVITIALIMAFRIEGLVRCQCRRCHCWGWRWRMTLRLRPQYHDSGFERVHYCEPCLNLKALDDAAQREGMTLQEYNRVDLPAMRGELVIPAAWRHALTKRTKTK